MIKLPRLTPDQLLLARLTTRGFSPRTIDLGSCRINYVEKTEPGRPTILFVHGFSAAAVHFERVFPVLYKRGYNILALDLPGHGLSSEHCEPLSADRIYESLVGFTEKAAPQKFLLVGNSLGASLGLRYAINHSERVQAIAAISPAGGFETEQDWEAFKRGLQIKSKAEVRAFLAKVLRRPPWYLPLFYGFMIRSMNRKGVRELLALTKFEDFAEGHRLANLAMPLLFVWGKDERLLPGKSLEWFKRNLPAHAIVDEPDGVGHCPQLDSARWLSARLNAFFKDTS